MELQTFLGHFQKVKPDGTGQYKALCPAHDDKHPSLSIKLDKEKILLKCFAGCTNEAIVQALGLSMADLFIDQKIKDEPIATYNYTDETGNLLFQVCRFQPKSFKQRHKGPNGEWVWNMKGVRKVLYHLPDIIRAHKIYFVEGEKDADNLWDCGLVATTSPGGAKAWSDTYIEPLINKKVVLIPDMDEPGLAYAREVAFALMGKSQLSCILLPSPHKDISDWIASRKPTSKDAPLEQDIIGELEKMEQDISALLQGKRPSYELIDDAVVWQHNPIQFKAENIRKERTGLHAKLTILYKYQPLAWSVFNVERSEERTKLARLAFSHLKPEVKNAYPEDALKQDFDLFCADLWGFYLSQYTPELVYGNEKSPPLVFLLAPYVMQGGGTIIFAPPGRGKSNTALLWAQSINSGVSKFWPVKQAPVLYINLERSRNTIERRLSCINKLLDLPVVTPLRILNARGHSLSDVFDACRRAVKQHDIQVIILDSISRAGFGDLTENRPVNAIIDTLSSLCETWVALAHTPRMDETHIYGGVMFDAGADIVVKLSSVVGNNGTLGLSYEITKANDITRGPIRMYAMEFNETGLYNFRLARPYEFPELEGQVKKPIMQAITDYILEQDTGEATATDIAEALNLNRSTVASILTRSGKFVQTRKEGRNVYYGVKETHV